MKKVFLFVFLNFCIIPVFAQTENKIELLLSSGKVNHIITQNPWEALSPDSAESINGRYYRHIRFATLPTFEKQKALESAGVKLLYYVSNKTYFASVSNGASAPLDPSFSIEGVFKISAIAKMHSELSTAIAQNSFPSFAINETFNIWIVFTYPTDMPIQLVIDRLSNYEITYQNQNSHRIIVWIPKENISDFVNQPFVCVAELKDDLPVLDNNVGRTNHRDNWLAQDFPGGRMYNGAGVNVMLQDDGLIGPHIDYTGRLIQQYLTNNIGNHGDHCAGILMGGGNLNPLSRGMGWGANLFVYRAVPYQGFDSIYSHYLTNSIVISSTSYSDGCNAGYTTLAQTLDQQIYNMPNLMHVFSAGNLGASDCSYGAGVNWGNITGGHKHSKNTIAVGNLDYTDVINASSSRGPAHDGRMKPEVCAVGTNVYSTVDTDTYAVKTGTSMSCPAVAGTLADLYQAYKTLNGNVNPPSGLIKTIIMNTADDLGNSGHDFIYGYGRINGRKAIIPIEQNLFIVDSVANNSSNTHTISVPANTGKVKVLVYWHDYPAAVNAAVALVNDIDIQVTNPSATVFNPWVLDFTPNASNLNSVAVQGNDIRNNHEQVTIDNPVQGNYTVSVNGSAIPFGPQKYFLSWYFEPLNELVLIYPNGSEGFDPTQTETIRWDALGNSGTFKLEYSTDNGLSWLLINSSIPAIQRYFDWVVPLNLSGECLVRVSRGLVADTSDFVFTIFPIPSNIVVDWACPDSLQLSWDPLSGATSYDVFMLGNMYMDSIGHVTTNSITIHNLNNSTNTYWFSVRARGAQNAIGIRADAVKKVPGIICPGYYDASVTSIISPTPFYLSCINTTPIPVVVQLYNPGLTSLNNIPVSFSINGGPAVNETYLGTLASFGTTTYTFTATVSLSISGNNSIKAWSAYPSDVNTVNDTTGIIVNYSTAVIVPPFIDNFEFYSLCSSASNCEATTCNLINGFKNLLNGQSDDIDWITFEGTTPSTTTGPDLDFVPGNAYGNYLYLEASFCFGKTAIVQSPCIDLTSSPNATLNFAYHMYGNQMGSLHVDIYSGGVWINNIFTRSGDQGNLWHAANISLSAYAGQIVVVRFRGLTGSGYASDMAIDAINLTNISSVEEDAGGFSITVFPNPAEGIFKLSISNLNNDEVSACVYDMSGRRVVEVGYGVANGMLSSTIDLSEYDNGSYILKIMVGEEAKTIRLVKME